MFGESNLHAVSDGLRVLRTLFTEWRRARATRRLERRLDLTVARRGRAPAQPAPPGRLTAARSKTPDCPPPQRRPSRESGRPRPRRTDRHGDDALGRSSGRRGPRLVAVALPELDAEEQRVLGVLLEKQVTVPATYPMTLAAVRTGCNQSSSREPVVDYDEPTVEATLRRLKDRQLVRVVWADSGRRTLKYHQLLSEVLELDDAERALVTVLLLRGAQAPGELRTRTDRLHALRRPRGRRGGPRRPGRPARAAGPRAAPPARPARRALGAPARRRRRRRRARSPRRPRRSTATRCWRPAPRPATSGSGRPTTRSRRRTPTTWSTSCSASCRSSRWLLDRVAAHADGGPVVEVGCGPGHVTAYLAEAGADASGIDLSPGWSRRRARRFPDGDYQVGDLRRLMRPISAPGWAAVLAWYSLIHLAASELPDALAALTRPLVPGGWLVVALHAGRRSATSTTGSTPTVDLDFVLHDPAEVVALVEAAGLTDVEWYHRGPITARGETTQRLYVDRPQAP